VNVELGPLGGIIPIMLETLRDCGIAIAKDNFYVEGHDFLNQPHSLSRCI
jgi:hypothetical protein